MPYFQNMNQDFQKLINQRGIHPSIRGQFQDQWNNQGFGQLGAIESSLPNADMINQLFNISRGNLSQAGYQARGRAQSDAGAMAGARGFLNPSAFTLGAGNQAFSPFVGAMQGLEANRAQAQTELPYNNLRAMLPFLQMAMQNNQFQQQQDQNQAGFFDYLGALAPLLAAPFTGGTSLLGYLAGAGKSVMGGGGFGGGGFGGGGFGGIGSGVLDRTPAQLLGPPSMR